MDSYKKNKFKLYYLDKNNKKIIIDRRGTFSEFLNESFLIDNKIVIEKLFLEFNNDEFINNDPIFGIKEEELDYILKKFNNIWMPKNELPVNVIKQHQKILINYVIRKKNNNYLYILFDRELHNILYTNEFFELNVNNIKTLINKLNDKIEVHKHWVFEFDVFVSTKIYFSKTIGKLEDFFYKDCSKRRISTRLKNDIKNILEMYKKYQYYGVIADFFNTWACNYYFIGDYIHSNKLNEIANYLFKIYVEHRFIKTLNNKYISDNYKIDIEKEMKIWISKKKIFEGNLKNCINKLEKNYFI
jgi:hypothetical protein